MLSHWSWMQEKKKRAFEVMDIDITNSARFGTKGLGSTTVTWIKWNADGCFSDTAVLGRQDKRMSAFSRTCWHHWYPHNRVECGNALASQPVGTSQFVDDSLLLNTGLGTGITAKKRLCSQRTRAPALPTDSTLQVESKMRKSYQTLALYSCCEGSFEILGSSF